jgi:hypothetical protein
VVDPSRGVALETARCRWKNSSCCRETVERQEKAPGCYCTRNLARPVEVKV